MKISALARKNARQSVSVIMMIALASMLICSVVNLGVSGQKGVVDSILEVTGDNQAAFTDMTEEQEAWVSAQKEVALADLQMSVKGWGNPPGDEETNIGMLYSSGLGRVTGFKLTAGRAPEAENEAVIPPHVAQLLGIEPKVGEEFEILYREWGGDGMITEGVPMRFVVSGILQGQRMYAAMGLNDMFVSRNLAERLDHGRMLYLRFDKKYEPRSTALRLAEEAGLTEKNVSFNDMYLNAKDLNDPTVIIFVVCILLILGAAGALVIYNAYNLSVTRKVHQYGLLTVIGASKKQLRRCVYLEALICAGIGLPAGLLTGTLFGYAGTSALSGLSGEPIAYVLTPWAYLLSAAVTVVMVLIGVTRPARKVSRIAPVEAVRFADAGEKALKRGTLENVTPNALARINLSRARGRTVGTVVSLSLSGILFLGFSTVAFSMRDSAGGIIGYQVYGDIQVTAGQDGVARKDTGPITREMADTMGGLDGVEKMTAVMAQGLCEVTRIRDGEEYPDGRGVVIGVEPDILQDVIDNVYGGKVTLADFEDPQNVIAVIPSDYIIDFYTNTNGVDYRKVLESYRAGNRLGFTLTAQNGWFTDETADLNIVGLVREDDIKTLIGGYSMYPDFYTLQDSFAALGWDTSYERVILDIDGAKHDDIYSVLEQLCGQNAGLLLQSFKRMRDELARQLTGIIVIVLLMLGVVALNGVMNLIGTTVMGIEQRKKELGVLMAVGLSRKAVGKMLTREGLWVSVFCSALSVVFGLGLGIGLYYLLVNTGADYMRFLFPFWPLVSLCAVLGLVPYTVTLLAARRLRRFTVVELLGRQV